MVLLLDQAFDFIQTATEPFKHSAHVTSLLHGNESRVIFLVHPYEEVLVIVMPDPAGIGPVPRHTCAG